MRIGGGFVDERTLTLTGCVGNGSPGSTLRATAEPQLEVVQLRNEELTLQSYREKDNGETSTHRRLLRLIDSKMIRSRSPSIDKSKFLFSSLSRFILLLIRLKFV